MLTSLWSTAKTLIKDRAQLGLDGKSVFEKENNLLCQVNDEGLFVMAWMGIVEISTVKLTFVYDGHNPPLVSSCRTGFDLLIILRTGTLLNKALLFVIIGV